MSIQSAKEDFNKNLKENRLIITKEDENKSNLLKEKIKDIKKNLKDLSLHNSRPLKRHRRDPERKH